MVRTLEQSLVLRPRVGGDPETNFALFGPVATAPSSEAGTDTEATRRAFAQRPYQDSARALGAFCRDCGITCVTL
jgi:hypothetical protein